MRIKFILNCLPPSPNPEPLWASRVQHSDVIFIGELRRGMGENDEGWGRMM